MRKPLLLLVLLALSSSLLAQKRYYDKIFTQVQKGPDLVYGNNYTYDILSGEAGLMKEDLTLDIYYPAVEDTVRNRPLIIWAHGGSFLGGTKDDADIVYFCNEYAKRGFVCASINYRIGYELPLDSVAAVRTVYRALQDGRAAVRYMRSVASDYGIDKDRVYFGGTSAGAFIALNMAYLNLPEEVPSYVDTSAHDDLNTDPRFGLDGIEGTTNSIAESSTIHGIINYCGATKVTSWMDDEYSHSMPLISMHGTNDSTVPYGTRIIYLNDLTPIPPQVPLPIVQVQGSYDIDRHAKAQGYTSRFYTWYGADHVPYINFNSDSASKAYMDTLMSFTVKHVYQDFLGLGEVDGQGENEPPCDFNNGVTVPCSQVGIEEVSNQETQVYPNPATTTIQLGTKVQSARLIDITGREIMRRTSVDQLNVETIPAGVYSLEITDGNKTNAKKVVVHH